MRRPGKYAARMRAAGGRRGEDGNCTFGFYLVQLYIKFENFELISPSVVISICLLTAECLTGNNQKA